MQETAEWLDREALAQHISVRVDALPRLQRARIGDDIAIGAVRAVQPAAAEAREFGERALHAGSLVSSAATTSWSRNARRTVPTI